MDVWIFDFKDQVSPYLRGSGSPQTFGFGAVVRTVASPLFPYPADVRSFFLCAAESEREVTVPSASTFDRRRGGAAAVIYMKVNSWASLRLRAAAPARSGSCAMPRASTDLLRSPDRSIDRERQSPSSEGVLAASQ